MDVEKLHIKKKKIKLAYFFFIAIFLLFFLLIFEVTSFFAVQLLGFIKPEFRIDKFLQLYFDSEEQFKNSQVNTYDEVLGWDYKANGQGASVNVLGESWTVHYDLDASRLSLHKDKPLLISTYGDSFVHGDEVDDDNTWQFFLEEILNGQIKNFGVGAYGTDQALLKFKLHMDKGIISPITILGVFEGDISRITTNFRPFVVQETDVKLGFKPSAVYKGGSVTYLPNPLSREATFDEARSLAIKLAETDLGAKRQLYLWPRFPYSLQTFKVAQILYGKVLEKITGKDRINRWHAKEDLKIMEFMIADFVNTACKNKSIPVLLFLPDTFRWQKGRRPPQYLNFKETIGRKYKGGVIIDIYDADFDERKYTLIPLRGHLSPYGNRIVAGQIANKVKPIVEKYPNNFHQALNTHCPK